MKRRKKKKALELSTLIGKECRIVWLDHSVSSDADRRVTHTPVLMKQRGIITDVARKRGRVFINLNIEETDINRDLIYAILSDDIEEITELKDGKKYLH